jgi:hypothetical protein
MHWHLILLYYLAAHMSLCLAVHLTSRPVLKNNAFIFSPHPPPTPFKSTFINLCITDNIVLCLCIILGRSLFWPQFEPDTCRTQVNSVTTSANLCTVYFTVFLHWSLNTFNCTSELPVMCTSSQSQKSLKMFLRNFANLIHSADGSLNCESRSISCLRIGNCEPSQLSFFPQRVLWEQSCLLMFPLEKVHSCNKHLQWPDQPTMNILLCEKVYPYTYVCYICCCTLGLIH